MKDLTRRKLLGGGIFLATGVGLGYVGFSLIKKLHANFNPFERESGLYFYQDTNLVTRESNKKVQIYHLNEGTEEDFTLVDVLYGDGTGFSGYDTNSDGVWDYLLLTYPPKNISKKPDPIRGYADNYPTSELHNLSDTYRYKETGRIRAQFLPKLVEEMKTHMVPENLVFDLDHVREFAKRDRILLRR